eukprot:13246_1
MDNKSIIFEGYLNKESMYLKTLRKRWIVLTNDQQIYSYKQERNYANPTEIIDLKLCINVKIIKGNKFSLIFDKNKQRIFVAESQNEMDEWIKYIQTTINDEKHNSTDVLVTFEKLINIGFNEDISLKAA